MIIFGLKWFKIWGTRGNSKEVIELLILHWINEYRCGLKARPSVYLLIEKNYSDSSTDCMHTCVQFYAYLCTISDKCFERDFKNVILSVVD